MESSSTPSSGRVSAMKAQAHALQQQEFDQGRVLKLGHALDAVARQHGYKDWNVASAAAKALDLKAIKLSYVWEDIQAPLATLPMRMNRRPDATHNSIKELMRWAKQIDLIADNVPDEAKREMLVNIGGKKPYVFVSEVHRFGDDAYRLCTRSYSPIKGLVFTREQLETIGAVAWNKQHGTHDGDHMVSLIHDEVATTRDRTKLKMAARLLGSVAILADSEWAKTSDSIAITIK